MLIDPVLSGSASPIGTTKAFPGSDHYKPSDIPEIDYLIISHDHYDHLDYKTVKQLLPKVKQVICGLGTGEHLEHWGYKPNQIIEKDWHEVVELNNEMKLYILPARHFSGRNLKRNNTLWMSCLLATKDQKIFLGGDSGYGSHFKEIGDKFGSIDIAILENGQYNKAWHEIHCLPEETLMAAKDLNAKKLMPVHNSKFTLALHSWKEPLQSIYEYNKQYNIPLITPKIGEPVVLNTDNKYTNWQQDLV